MLKGIRASSMARTNLPLYLTTSQPPRCPRHHYHERPVLPSLSDHVLCTALGSLTYTRCRSSILSKPEHPDLRRTDWPKFQACLEAGLLSNPDLQNEVAIDACVKELSSAISTESTPKCRPRADLRSPLTARIQDEIHPKNWLRKQWQVTRDPALKAEGNCLQRSVTSQLNASRNDQWSNKLGTLDPETFHCGR
jgi:hypothetical protein